MAFRFRRKSSKYISWRPSYICFKHILFQHFHSYIQQITHFNGLERKQSTCLVSSAFPIGMILDFLSASHRDTSYQVSCQLVFFAFGEHKTDGGHLGFPIGMILAIFDLYIVLILPTKFSSQMTFRRPAWISDRSDFSYF